MSDCLQPHGLYSSWNSPGQNIRVGSLSLPQGIFPTQGLNPGLPHCRQILYQLGQKGPILFIFVFISMILGDGSKKMLLQFTSESILAMSPSRSFVMSALTLRSLIHFERIFVYVVKEWFNLIFYMCLSHFPRTICWRDCLSNIVWACLLCHRLIDYRCMGLFWGFPSCSINLYVYFCASTILFWWL